MNKQGPSGIEWCDYTWNPIKGLCPVGCWYCYARKMYKRFKWNPDLRLDLDSFGRYSSWNPDAGPDHPSKIFVCSTMEIFHSNVPDSWRDDIFNLIQDNPQHTFIILTKMPDRIDRPMPDNVWLGTSVTGMDDIDRISSLLHQKAKIKFISYEPLLEFPAIPGKGINWVIIGRLTQHGKRHDPPKRWIDKLVEMSHALKYPVFLKNNLRDIWEPKLIQEFPK